MKALGIATIAGLLALVSIPARADGSAANPPASPPGAEDRGVTGAGSAHGNQRQPRSLPTTNEKQRAVEQATKAGNAASGKEALGDRGPPNAAKSWEEMTPDEKDAARKRWLLNSGDFGPRRGIPRATPSPSTEKGGAVIDGPRPRTPQEKIRTK